MKKYAHIYYQRPLGPDDVAEDSRHQAAIDKARGEGKQIDTDGCKVFADGFYIARIK